MASPVFSEARILVVDDEPANVLLLERLLERWGYANVVRSAPLHDIGKVGVPDAILLKRGRLTTDEFELKGRTLIGGRILAHSVSEVLRGGEVIARTHHERWDGNGYPAGLAGEAIPHYGRLVALALTHERPYKPAWPLDRAAAEIRRVAGQQLDPAVVRSFERLDHSMLLASTGAVGGAR
jgi:putative two-component system response regulator